MTDAELQRLAAAIVELAKARPGLSVGGGLGSALIAGVVALLVSWGNNRFQRLSKEDEHRKRRREWFLEKQARDVEEIIVALEKFAKITATLLGETSYLPDRLSSAKNIESGYGRASYENYDHAMKNVALGLTNTNSFKPWFEYDSLRLTAWLEQSEQRKSTFAELLRQFSDITSSAMSANVLVGQAAHLQNPLSNPLDKAQFEELIEKANSEIEDNQKSWGRLIENISVFQSELIASLREG